MAAVSDAANCGRVNSRVEGLVRIAPNRQERRQSSDGGGRKRAWVWEGLPDGPGKLSADYGQI